MIICVNTFNVNLIKCCWIMLMAVSNAEKWLSHTKSGHFFLKMVVARQASFHFWNMVVARLLWTFLKNLRLFDWNNMAGLFFLHCSCVMGQCPKSLLNKVTSVIKLQIFSRWSPFEISEHVNQYEVYRMMLIPPFNCTVFMFIHLWHFGFCLLFWHGINGISWNFADTLISTRCALGIDGCHFLSISYRVMAPDIFQEMWFLFLLSGDAVCTTLVERKVYEHCASGVYEHQETLWSEVQEVEEAQVWYRKAKKKMWATARENLSMGIIIWPGLTQTGMLSYRDNLVSRVLKFLYSKYRYYTIKAVNNNGTDQTRRCAKWSVPMFFTYGINRFTHDVAQH